MIKFIPALTVAAASTAALAFPPLPTTTWNEQGDAGQTIAGAQSTVGPGQLQHIFGALTTASDVDMYCIRITDEAAFHASVVTYGGGDSMLWLFNPDGTLQAGNDDYDDSYLSTIDSTGVFTSGIYYLAMCHFGVAPLDSTESFVYGGMWGDSNQYSGNGRTLHHWSVGYDTGAYHIVLAGAQFAPTPGAAALLGLGSLLINRRRRTP